MPRISNNTILMTKACWIMLKIIRIIFYSKNVLLFQKNSLLFHKFLIFLLGLTFAVSWGITCNSLELTVLFWNFCNVWGLRLKKYHHNCQNPELLKYMSYVVAE